MYKVYVNVVNKFADLYCPDRLGGRGHVRQDGEQLPEELTYSIPLSCEVDRDGIETRRSKLSDVPLRRVTVAVGSEIEILTSIAGPPAPWEPGRSFPQWTPFVVPRVTGWVTVL